MNSGHNNPPAVILELTQEEATFILDNCESNIAMGLNLLQASTSEATARKVVDMMENFKTIRAKVQKGMS